MRPEGTSLAWVAIGLKTVLGGVTSSARLWAVLPDVAKEPSSPALFTGAENPPPQRRDEQRSWSDFESFSVDPVKGRSTNRGSQ